MTDSRVPSSSPAVGADSDLGQFDIDDLPELILCVVGDADHDDVAFVASPLVGASVLQIGGYVHGCLLPGSCLRPMRIRASLLLARIKRQSKPPVAAARRLRISTKNSVPSAVASMGR